MWAIWVDECEQGSDGEHHAKETLFDKGACNCSITKPFEIQLNIDWILPIIAI